MKKKQFIILILLGVFYLPFSLNAQVNLSGNFGFNYVKSGDSNSVLFYNVTPKIGFEINDKIHMGALIGYTGLSFKQNNSYYGVGNESIGIINVGVYGRINTFGTEKLRLLIEPTLSFGIETENTNLLIHFATVPVVQLRITEKIFFDMTLGLMGLSIVSVPDSDFLELNFGLNNVSSISDLNLFGATNSTLTPFQLGLTFSL